MNHVLASKVLAAINNYKKNFDMSFFFRDLEKEKGSSNILVSLSEIAEGECGTTMCVAGWAVLIHDGTAKANDDLSGAARRYLDISYEFADWLFFLIEDRPEGLTREEAHSWKPDGAEAKRALELMSAPGATEAGVMHQVAEEFPWVESRELYPV